MAGYGGFAVAFKDACEELRRTDGPLTARSVAPAIAGYQFFFNYEQPHTRLVYRSPNEYANALEAACTLAPSAKGIEPVQWF